MGNCHQPSRKLITKAEKTITIGGHAHLGLKRLAREYTPARLEAACTRALAIRSPNLRSVSSILKSGLDRQQSLLPATTPALPDHENVRGPDYYH